VSSNIHTALSRNDWHLNLVHDLPSQSLQRDPGIDDPVNDTGLVPRCGDFQVSQSSSCRSTLGKCFYCAMSKMRLTGRSRKYCRSR
jgi:hypothetical protein